MNGAGELYSRALLLVKPCSLLRIPLAIESIATEPSINTPLSRSWAITASTPNLSKIRHRINFAQTLERARSWVLETSYYLGHPLSLWKSGSFQSLQCFFYRKFIVDDRVMDMIMKIYANWNILEVSSFFFCKKNITGILGELRVNFTRAPQRQMLKISICTQLRYKR